MERVQRMRAVLLGAIAGGWLATAALAELQHPIDLRPDPVRLSAGNMVAMPSHSARMLLAP